jgi:hypothetical protein
VGLIGIIRDEMGWALNYWALFERGLLQGFLAHERNERANLGTARPFGATIGAIS